MTDWPVYTDKKGKVRASRDIAKGEEISVTGYEYSQIMKQEKKEGHLP